MAEITEQEIAGALSRSGYLLEARVEEFLVKSGYGVDANIGYPDPVEGKVRELDARAMKGSLIQGRHTVWTTLLIECSNNLQPLALMAKKPPHSISPTAVPCSGIPTTVESDPVQQRLRLDEFHHYWQGSLATQFCSFQRKKEKDDWMASHDEGQWASIKKLGDTLAFDTHELQQAWEPPRNDEAEPINLTLHYCVLVLQGSLVEVDARQAR
ncbi:MAG TPA: hypothetical protein VFP50_13590, partial [Anaeromyxobacteraceae bacterium]|nr:hypothetical protein [Anaeromyxobacteraceae bacterium]